MESYAVEMTRQAEEQLSEIVQYISLTLRSPQAGMNTLDALEEEIGSLSVMPFRYPAIEDDPAGDRGIRKTRAKNFNIYYQVDDARKRVNILAVCYARREQKKIIESVQFPSEEHC